MSSFILSCLLSSAALAAEPTPQSVEPIPFAPLEGSAPAAVAPHDGTAALAGAEALAQPIDYDLAGSSLIQSAQAAAAIGAATVAGNVQADAPERVEDDYDAGTFFRQAKSIPWRLGGAAAAITLTGLANWDWGSSKFHFEREGWFGKDTASLGMDKLGHAYSAYVLAEFFTDGINKSYPGRRSTSYTGALLSMGLMTYIEVFDGFSKDHGFSHEDLIVDAAGALFSVARRTVPGLREKLDFRLLYTPDRRTLRALGCLPEPHCDREGETVRSPITDYSNQRYLLALKLAGFDRLADTPLRFVELHTGYYARGFTAEEESRGDPLRRRIFFGAGLNVGELLFPGRPRGGVGRALKSVLEYLQLPYTAVHSN